MTLILLLMPSSTLVCKGQGQCDTIPGHYVFNFRANAFKGSMRLRAAYTGEPEPRATSKSARFSGVMSSWKPF